MPASASFYVSAHLTQALSAIMLALLLGSFYRHYGHRHLRSWAISWTAFAVYLVSSAVILAGLANGDSTPAGRLALSTVSQFAGLCQLIFLAFGLRELSRPTAEPRRPRSVFWWLLLALAYTGVIVWTTVEAESTVRLFARVGLRAGLACATFAIAARIVHRSTSANRSRGGRLLVFALSLYAIDQAYYFLTTLVDMIGPFRTPIIPFVGLFDIVIHVAIGFGMVIQHLEYERERALTAVSALKQSEDRLAHAEKLETVGRLAGGIAHDFNNLLTAVLGYSDLVRLRVEEDATAKGWLSRIDESVDRARTMTSQLLAFGRKQVASPRTLDLGSEVRARTEMLTRLLEPHVHLQLELATTPLLVRMDPAQLEQILLNLALNARDAIRDRGVFVIGSEAIALDVSKAQQLGLAPGDHVLWTLADNGPGMDESMRERIFEPYFTTKGPSKGSGLGLASVHGIVHQSNGAIEVASEPNRGTQFRVWLPRMQGVADATPPHGAAHRSPAVRPSFETVLLAEDRDEVRETVVRSLEGQGYRVLAARDAEEAIRIFDSAEHVDLLLTDVAMPGMSGVELARELRTRRTDLPVVAMSGYAEPGSGAENFGKLDVSYLAKPFAPTELLLVVRTAIEQAATRSPASAK
ncbi:MAG: response regulator [Planctomycetota bacterium]